MFYTLLNLADFESRHENTYTLLTFQLTFLVFPQFFPVAYNDCVNYIDASVIVHFLIHLRLFGYPRRSTIFCLCAHLEITANSVRCQNLTNVYIFYSKGDVLLNQTCKHSDQCSTSPYAACLEDRCKCIEGYKAKNDSFCEKGKRASCIFCIYT